MGGMAGMITVVVQVDDQLLQTALYSLRTRFKEHKAAYRLGSFERSAVTGHTWLDGHSIKWDNSLIPRPSQLFNVTRRKAGGPGR